MTAALGFDVSNHQPNVNFGVAQASGREFVVLKATEGTGFTDASYAAKRAAAHAAGLIVGAYHFARAGDPAAEAAYFLRVVGSLAPGEFLVLDWETTYSGDHVAWCKAWLDAVYAATGARALIYMNQSEMNSWNWTPISGDHGLWLAKYDGSTAPTAACSCWPSGPAMKQYSDAGTVSGVSTPCDVNVFYGSAQQLASYGSSPTPGGFLMALSDAEQSELLDRVRKLDAFRDWGFVPDDGSNFPSSKGEVTKRIREIAAGQAAQNATLAALLSRNPAVTVDAATIAAAIPANLAAQVADELSKRLQA